MFDEVEQPTEKQRLVEGIFLATYETVNKILGLGWGAGKTWFWARAVRYMMREDPIGMQEELARLGVEIQDQMVDEMLGNLSP